MRLLFVLENYTPHMGGVEVFFQELCKQLAERGHTVTIVTRRLPGTRKYETVDDVHIIRVPSLGSRYLFSLLAIPRVLKEAKRADVIHTTTYNAMFPSWLGRTRGTPAIVTVHETWLDRWEEFSDFSKPVAWLHDKLERLLYKITQFDSYVCISDSTRSMLETALPDLKGQTKRVYNGFDPDMWKKTDKAAIKQIRTDLELDKKFVIFASGRPGTSKGYQYLVDAFPRIKKAIPKAVLLLALSTDRQYKHRIKQFKKRAHDAVFFLKPQPYAELPSFRQMADCVVVPSLAEGFGLAVLESCWTDTPVVTTNTTSIPEVVCGNHVLVKPGSEKALADGVIAVHKKKFTKAPLKQFPWRQTVAGYEKIYEELRHGT